MYVLWLVFSWTLYKSRYLLYVLSVGFSISGEVRKRMMIQKNKERKNLRNMTRKWRKRFRNHLEKNEHQLLKCQRVSRWTRTGGVSQSLRRLKRNLISTSSRPRLHLRKHLRLRHLRLLLLWLPPLTQFLHHWLSQLRRLRALDLKESNLRLKFQGRWPLINSRNCSTKIPREPLCSLIPIGGTVFESLFMLLCFWAWGEQHVIYIQKNEMFTEVRSDPHERLWHDPESWAQRWYQIACICDYDTVPRKLW